MSALGADGDGSRRFRLGVIELWIVGVCALLIVALISKQYLAITQTQADTAKKLGDLTTQVAVMNGQLSVLSQQLADVPALTRQMTQVQTTLQEHERRITKLEDAPR